METTSSDNTGIIIFFVVLFLVLFVLPVWLMVLHNKKTKEKLASRDQSQSIESHEEAKSMRDKHRENVGVFIGVIVVTLTWPFIFSLESYFSLGFIGACAVAAIVGKKISQLTTKESDQ